MSQHRLEALDVCRQRALRDGRTIPLHDLSVAAQLGSVAKALSERNRVRVKESGVKTAIVGARHCT